MKLFTRLLLYIILSGLLFTQKAERKGFFWSISFGPTFTSYEVKGEFTKPNGSTVFYDSEQILSIDQDNIQDAVKYPYSESGIGLRTHFNIGYGLTDRFLVSYANKVDFSLGSSIHRSNYYVENSETVLSVNGISGIEFKYFLSQNIIGYYISATPGLAVFTQPFVSGYLTKTGFGFDISGGYQFSENSSLNLSILYASGSLKSGIKNDIEGTLNGVKIDGEYNALSIAAILSYQL